MAHKLLRVIFLRKLASLGNILLQREEKIKNGGDGKSEATSAQLLQLPQLPEEVADVDSDRSLPPKPH